MSIFRVRCTLGNIHTLTTKLDVELTVNGIIYSQRLKNTTPDAESLGEVLFSGTTFDFFGYTATTVGNSEYFRNGDILRVRIRQGTQYNPVGPTTWGPWLDTNYTIANGAIVTPNFPVVTASPQVTLVIGTPTLTARAVISYLDPAAVKLKYSVSVNGTIYPGETDVVINIPGANTIDVVLYNVATGFIIDQAVQFLVKAGVSDGMGGFIYSNNYGQSNVIRIGWTAPPAPGAVTNTMSTAAV